MGRDKRRERREFGTYLAKSISLSIIFAAELKYSLATPTTSSTVVSYDSLNLTPSSGAKTFSCSCPAPCPGGGVRERWQVAKWMLASSPEHSKLSV